MVGEDVNIVCIKKNKRTVDWQICKRSLDTMREENYGKKSCSQ